MTIKTDATGKVILSSTFDIEGDGMYRVDKVPQVEVGKDLYYNGSTFYMLDNPHYDEFMRRKALLDEREAIQLWMDKTDYYTNKITRKNWTESHPKWVAYLAEYDVKHARKEQIEAILGITND